MPAARQHTDRPVGQPAHQLVLGVDGGGTKTTAWLAECLGPESYTTLGTGEGGPSNPQAIGLAAAQQEILRAVHAAFTSAQQSPCPVASACLALAGAGREPMRQAMQQWSEQQHLAPKIQVIHDAQAVLSAGTSTGTGVALICGTGSFAYGTSASGDTARAGGWGYLIGDEGSAFALGHEALRAVAREADGRGEPTRLSRLLLQRLHLQQPAELIPTIYNSLTPREDIAALAACVFLAAGHHDPVAQRIVNSAVRELAALVESVVRKLLFTPDQYQLALAGGVLVNQPEFRTALHVELAKRGMTPRAATLVTDPVAGAVTSACRLL